MKMIKPLIWTSTFSSIAKKAALVRFSKIQLSTVGPDIWKPVINDYGSRIEVKLKSWPRSIDFSYYWLRDHCRCHTCYNKGTSQRILDLAKVPLTVKPHNIVSDEKELQIDWSDGHNSQYTYKYLWQSSYEGMKGGQTVPTSLWNAKTFPEEDQFMVPFGKYETQEGLAQLMKNILKYGVGMVTEVEPTISATRDVVERVCMIQETFFGKMWNFTSDSSHADLAYSSMALGAHTDGTYFAEAPKIQVFHCLKASEEGGETLLVDGFQIARKFKANNPQGYHLLTDLQIPSEYIGDGVHLMAVGSTFRHNAISKALEQFRYNINDRAPLNTIPFKDIDKYYECLLDVTKYVTDPSNEVWARLTPGQVLFIDNWRVMHGRASFKGLRHMAGCYLGASEFQSKARLLGFNV